MLDNVIAVEKRCLFLGRYAVMQSCFLHENAILNNSVLRSLINARSTGDFLVSLNKFIHRVGTISEKP